MPLTPRNKALQCAAEGTDCTCHQLTEDGQADESKSCFFFFFSPGNKSTKSAKPVTSPVSATPQEAAPRLLERAQSIVCCLIPVSPSSLKSVGSNKLVEVEKTQPFNTCNPFPLTLCGC